MAEEAIGGCCRGKAASSSHGHPQPDSSSRIRASGPSAQATAHSRWPSWDLPQRHRPPRVSPVKRGRLAQTALGRSPSRRLGSATRMRAMNKKQALHDAGGGFHAYKYRTGRGRGVAAAARRWIGRGGWLSRPREAVPIFPPQGRRRRPSFAPFCFPRPGGGPFHVEHIGSPFAPVSTLQASRARWGSGSAAVLTAPASRAQTGITMPGTGRQRRPNRGD